VEPLKDQKIVLKAFGQLPDQQLLLIGASGDFNYWNELQHSLPKYVRMPGGKENVAEILAAADFFVSASHHEGIPIAVLEAAAAGVPSLLSDIPRHRILATEKMETKGTLATFFLPGNLKALIVKIQELSNT